MTNTSYIDSIADKERTLYSSQSIPDRFIEVYKTTNYTGYLGLAYGNQGVRLDYLVSNHVISSNRQIEVATVAVQRHKNKVNTGLFNNSNFRYIPTVIHDPGVSGFIETLLYFEVNPLEFIALQFNLDAYLISTKQNINRPLNKATPLNKPRVILELKPK